MSAVQRLFKIMPYLIIAITSCLCSERYQAYTHPRTHSLPLPQNLGSLSCHVIPNISLASHVVLGTNDTAQMFDRFQYSTSERCLKDSSQGLREVSYTGYISTKDRNVSRWESLPGLLTLSQVWPYSIIFLASFRLYTSFLILQLWKWLERFSLLDLKNAACTDLREERLYNRFQLS